MGQLLQLGGNYAQGIGSTLLPAGPILDREQMLCKSFIVEVAAFQRMAADGPIATRRREASGGNSLPHLERQARQPMLKNPFRGLGIR